SVDGDDVHLGHTTQAGLPKMETQVELDIHRFIFRTSSQLKDAGDPEKVLRLFLRSAVELMEADRGYAAVLDAADPVARLAFVQPTGASCNLSLVTALLRREPVPIPPGTVCARLTRRGRPWGMLVLERQRDAFPEGFSRAFAHVGRAVSELIER